MFAKPIRDVLIADDTLVDLLAEYTPPDDGEPEPAIFSTDPVPEDASLPFIVLSGVVADEENDLKGFIGGRDVSFDIRCYTERSGSVVLVDQIAERIREVLHRASVPVAGLEHVDTRVSGPLAIDEPESYGRVLTARLLYFAP